MPTAEQAMLHLPTGVGESILVMSDLVTVKIRGQDSGGAFVVTEVSTPPQSGPPGLHRHPDQETFYVLEGTYRFDTLQGERRSSFEATRGSVVHIPSMVWHNYKNIGQVPGKVLVVLQPGNMLDFFRDLGIVVSDTSSIPQPAAPPNIQRVTAIVRKHSVEIWKGPADVNRTEQSQYEPVDG